MDQHSHDDSGEPMTTPNQNTKSETPTFTLDKGLQIQAQQVARWKELLRVEHHAALDAEVQRQNNLIPSNATTGDVIWRGTDIDNFVFNHL